MSKPNKKTIDKVSGSPMSKIAMCFSGGGYRAATFHLGALKYLDSLSFQNKPLIQKIETISTVSGGTITGVVYALLSSNGKEFTEIYDFIMNVLKNKDLVRESLKMMDNEIQWSSKTKRRNIINAFSELYDKHLTGGATFEKFGDMGVSHIKEVIFNSTEFDHGLNFRFQNAGVFGNDKLRIAKKYHKEVKLSDIIAASSAFPGGFEPIGFPEDFIHSESEHLQNFQKEKEESFGLMDGGIYDNQGIESVLMSDSRHDENNPYYDLIIVTDVTSPYMEEFQFHKSEPTEKLRGNSFNGLRKKTLSKIRLVPIIATIGVILGLLIAKSQSFSNHWMTGVGLTVSSFFLLLLISFIILKNKAKAQLNKLSNYMKKLVPQFYREQITSWNVTNYPFGRVENLILDRIHSLSLLIGSVFLKQVRRLQYDTLYEKDGYRFRRMSNLIQELTEMDYNSKKGKSRTKRLIELEGCPSELKGDYQSVIGDKLKNLCEEAAKFGTTLWFTKDNQLNDTLNKLVASGNATICFNLLVYLTELIFTPNNGFDNLTPKKKKELKALHQNCLSDWNRIKKEPLQF